MHSKSGRARFRSGEAAREGPGRRSRMTRDARGRRRVKSAASSTSSVTVGTRCAASTTPSAQPSATPARNLSGSSRKRSRPSSSTPLFAPRQQLSNLEPRVEVFVCTGIHNALYLRVRRQELLDPLRPVVSLDQSALLRLIGVASNLPCILLEKALRTEVDAHRHVLTKRQTSTLCRCLQCALPPVTPPAPHGPGTRPPRDPSSAGSCST